MGTAHRSIQSIASPQQSHLNNQPQRRKRTNATVHDPPWVMRAGCALFLLPGMFFAFWGAQKGKTMRIALTVWENRISPVADSAQQLLIVCQDGNVIGQRCLERFNCDSLFDKAGKLSEMHIDMFICGAISNFLATLVQGYGIRLVPFIRGGVDEVLEAFIAGRLDQQRFTMRGCRTDYFAAGSGFDTPHAHKRVRARTRIGHKSGLPGPQKSGGKNS